MPREILRVACFLEHNGCITGDVGSLLQTKIELEFVISLSSTSQPQGFGAGDE